jgi:predicted RNA binding protein YcfA (HicA-like mRNA interferase family)
MAPRLPAANARRTIRALEQAGFVVERTSGSHHLLVHPDDPARSVVVPFHGSKDLKPGTLRSIIRQAGLTVEEFVDLL